MIYKSPSHYLAALEANPDLTSERLEVEKPNEYMALHSYTLDGVTYYTSLSEIPQYIASGDWLFGTDISSLVNEEIVSTFFTNAVDMDINPTAPAFMVALIVHGSEVNRRNLMPSEDTDANFRSVEINCPDDRYEILIERFDDLPSIEFNIPCELWHDAFMEAVVKGSKSHTAQ